MATTFNDVAKRNSANIRDILEFVILAKPYEDGDDEYTQVWTPEEGLIVPPGYKDFGHTSKGDKSWTREQEWRDVTAHGYGEPVKRIATSDVEGLSVIALETNKLVTELYRDQHMDGVEGDSSNNVMWKKGSRPAGRRWRILAIGKEGDGPNAVYWAKWLPDAQVTEMGEQSWSEEESVQYQITLTAFTDESVGTSMVDVLGGPGFDAEAAGFTTSYDPDNDSGGGGGDGDD